MTIRKDVFGWFDDPFSETPTHDPGVENGICPICSKGLNRPVKTISLMKDRDSRSYFYRAHKDCYENLSEEDVTQLDISLIDNI